MNDPKLFYLRGKAFYVKGELKSAVINFNNATLIDETFFKAYYRRAICFLKLD